MPAPNSICSCIITLHINQLSGLLLIPTPLTIGVMIFGVVLNRVAHTTAPRLKDLVCGQKVL